MPVSHLLHNLFLLASEKGARYIPGKKYALSFQGDIQVEQYI
jgi:hypothetical protein